MYPNEKNNAIITSESTSYVNLNEQTEEADTTSWGSEFQSEVVCGTKEYKKAFV